MSYLGIRTVCTSWLMPTVFGFSSSFLSSFLTAFAPLQQLYQGLKSSKSGLTASFWNSNPTNPDSRMVLNTIDDKDNRWTNSAFVFDNHSKYCMSAQTLGRRLVQASRLGLIYSVYADTIIGVNSNGELTIRRYLILLLDKQTSRGTIRLTLHIIICRHTTMICVTFGLLRRGRCKTEGQRKTLPTLAL